MADKMDSRVGDMRDLTHLKKVFDETKPDIVIHMAAQPIVRESYRNPVYTYEVNVMGTVNILECVRSSSSVRSFLNVTTDKVYRNREWDWGYRENEELNGYDPYSNSKSCSELVTSSYLNSFFADRETAVSTARAGNVIGEETLPVTGSFRTASGQFRTEKRSLCVTHTLQDLISMYWSR